jgi:hypothetical protein
MSKSGLVYSCKSVLLRYHVSNQNYRINATWFCQFPDQSNQRVFNDL